MTERFFRLHWLRRPAELRTVTRRTSSPGARTWRRGGCLSHCRPPHPAQALGALLAVRLPLRENAVAGNPVDGVKRPLANGNEGSTPALGDAQARKLLDAPRRIRSKANAIAPSCYPALSRLRREELCGLRVRDIQSRQGVVHSG